MSLGIGVVYESSLLAHRVGAGPLTEFLKRVNRESTCELHPCPVQRSAPLASAMEGLQGPGIGDSCALASWFSLAKARH
jgi:hypothetical protein